MIMMIIMITTTITITTRKHQDIMNTLREPRSLPLWQRAATAPCRPGRKKQSLAPKRGTTKGDPTMKSLKSHLKVTFK